MEKIEYWMLCDKLTIVQAALLIVGVDPDEFDDVMELSEIKRPTGFNAVLTALIQDIELGSELEGNMELVPKEVIQEQEKLTITRKINPVNSIIRMDSLKKWLKRRNLTSNVFLSGSNASNKPDYLNSEHPHYSPKLAAAVYAWEAVSADSSLLRGKTVKQALVDWLEENAEQFGFLKDDKGINKQGLEETAKIANWVTKGGAPKTPF